jgi:hypothetical protein
MRLFTCVKVLRPLLRGVLDDKEEVYSVHDHYITGAEFSYTHCVQRNVRLTEIQTSQPKHAISHYYGINAQACFRRHFAVFHNERLPDFI